MTEIDKTILMESLEFLEKENEMTLNPRDDENFAKFSTQYADALVRFHHPSGSKLGDNGFWFGRLLDFRYEIQNFDNDPTPRNGLYFWGRLVRNDLKVSRFDLTEIGKYEPDGSYIKVKVKGSMDYSVNNTRYSADVELIHWLRPTWVAVKTEFTKFDCLVQEEIPMTDESKSDLSFELENLVTLGIVEKGLLAVNDDSNFGYFATQYYGALRKFHHTVNGNAADNGFWFGKMTTPRFKLKNWDATAEKSGQDFWEDLRANRYIFPTFTINRITYTEDTPGAGFRNATATVYGQISFKRPSDIQSTTVPFESVHKIRQVWAADETLYR